MITPYVDPENGVVWIEQGAGPWPAIQREARLILSEMGFDRQECVMRYEGLSRDVRVSDEREDPHGDDDGCADSQDVDFGAPGFVPCCRDIVAHRFVGRER